MPEAIHVRERFHQATEIVMVRHNCSRDTAITLLLDQAELEHCDLDEVVRRVLASSVADTDAG